MGTVPLGTSTVAHAPSATAALRLALVVKVALALGCASAPVPVHSDKEMVRQAIQGHSAEIRSCYEEQLAANPRLEGTVSIKWVIQADGSAIGARVEHGGATTLEDPRLHDCMIGQVTSWPFPKPRNGGIAVITYRWLFPLPASATKPEADVP